MSANSASESQTAFTSLEFSVIQVMDVETLLASLGVKRLSEVLSSFGIRLAEPMLIKKTAEARAAELRLLTDAISEADRKLPEGTTITYNKEGLSVVAKTSPKAREMLDRTSARFVATELLHGSTLNYGAFSHLAEIGLFFQGDIGIHPFRLGSEEVYFGFSDGTALAVTQAQPRPRVEPGVNIWHLTQSGRDLLRFCSWQTPDEYVEKFRDGIRKLTIGT